ncbi:MAG: arginine deiminase family protein, partial [Gemmatimonadota bacterium]|nr:arginine deiminase family protein [Gemmatimonadota bacterium]
MSRLFGAQSMVAPLRRVLVRSPDAAFGAADPARWHYTATPDLTRARDEHAAFVALLDAAGAGIIRHDAPLTDRADAIYVHDPALVTDRGAILLRMGKPLRRGEEEAVGAALEAAGVPVVARLSGGALAEGGDCLWLDERTLAVGLGFRTNAEGLRQIQAALGAAVEVVPVQLPYDQGPVA